MLSTLAEAKSSRLKIIAGSCPSSADFLSMLNEATRRLLRRGDWTGTVVPMYFCTYKGCVVFPRYVGQVRKINQCRQPIPVHNMYWDFVPDTVYPWAQCGLPCGAGGSWHPWASHGVSLGAKGYTPVVQDIMGDGRLIRAYPRCNEDIGKTLTIFGLDNNGQTLQTQNIDGTWSEGITLTLTYPFVSSATFVRQIDRVLKEITNCPVDVYAYNATDDVLEDVAHYEPTETNPQYRKYTLSMGPCGTNWDGCKKGVIALVKLAFVAARVDNDLVLIQNLDALKDMMQSIKCAEANDLEGAVNFEAKAIRELNRELEDEVPQDQIAMVDMTFGGMHVQEQMLLRCYGLIQFLHIPKPVRNTSTRFKCCGHGCSGNNHPTICSDNKWFKGESV